MTARSTLVLRRLSLLAAVFAFGLVMFGAFVRLSNAGLSCPDWPTCYGQATWPTAPHEVAKADAAFPQRPFEDNKAWREQVHRMLAGTLGCAVFAMALIAAWRQRARAVAVLLGAGFAVVGVTLYMHRDYVVSSLASAVAIGLPLVAALTLPRPGAWRASVLAFAVIIFQAMLGMWTVTLLLKPIVVMGHLLGGLTTFALLAWAALRYAGVGADDDRYARLRKVVVLGLALLASIAGNALWNRMSRLLPLTLVGQMILFESLLALVDGFLWECRLPTLLETLAFLLVAASVIACVAAHGRAVDPIGAGA